MDFPLPPSDLLHSRHQGFPVDPGILLLPGSANPRPIPPSESVLQDSAAPDLFDSLMGLWIPGFLVTFGILGNALSLLVLSRDSRRFGEHRCSTFTSLKALAVSDLVLLVGALLQQIIPMWCDVSLRYDAFCLNQGYARVYSWPVVCMAQMASIWLTVLISAERFVAICAPFSISRVGGVRRIKAAIAVIVVLSVAFNVPRFLEFSPIVEWTIAYDVITTSGDVTALNVTRIILGENDVRRDQTYRYLYNTALCCLVIYALPLLALTYLNVRLVRALRHARRNWCALNRTQRKEMKATTLPLVIVLVFFVCGTQSLLGFVLDAVFVNDSPVWLQVYTAFVNLLVVFNAAVNFLLLLCFGRKFRLMLAETVRCVGRQGGARGGEGEGWSGRRRRGRRRDCGGVMIVVNEGEGGDAGAESFVGGMRTRRDTTSFRESFV